MRLLWVTQTLGSFYSLWTFNRILTKQSTPVGATFHGRPPLGRQVLHGPALMTPLVPGRSQSQEGFASNVLSPLLSGDLHSVSCLNHKPLNHEDKFLKVWQLRPICLVLLIRS